MFLAQQQRHLAQICGAFALGLGACSLQAPSESEIFGSAGSQSAAQFGAAGSAGTQAEGGGHRNGGGAALADAGDGATPEGSDSGGAANAGGSSGAGASGASGGSTGFDPNAGLAAYFRFDEPSGALAANAKDSAKNAKCVGTCTRPEGQLGQAFGLRNDDSLSDWIELPAGILAGHSAITLALWSRDRSTIRSGAPLLHFSAGPKEAFSFVPADRNSRLSGGAHLSAVHGGESFVELWSSRVDLTDKSWHHVAIAWSADSIELYLDGRAAGSAAKPGVLPSQLGASSANYLGRSADDSLPALYGEIDDFRVYDRALSAAQIASLYKVR